MRKSQKCPKCGSTSIRQGKLYSQGGIWFEPAVKRGLLNFLPPRADVAGAACMTCGFIELYVHRLDKLAQAIAKHDNGEGEKPAGGVTEFTLD